MNNLKHFMTKHVHHLWDNIKHHPNKVATLLASLIALFQLAISQIHIAALVTVKLTVSTPSATNFTSGMPSIGIGMFMFLHILFGLATIFNVSRAKTPAKMWVGVISILVTLVFGFIFMLKMTNPDNIVDYQTLSSSVNWLIFGFVVYAMALVLTVYDIFRKRV